VNLAEELQLCAIGPDGRAPSSKLPAGFGGAVLADLSLAGRVQVGERVEVVDPAPVGDELLDRVLADLGDERIAETTVPQAVVGIGINASPRIHERIVAAGLVEVEAGGRSLIGLRKPGLLRPTAAGEEPRRRLRAAVLGELEPDERTAALVVLANECDVLKACVERSERRDAQRRAAEIGELGAIFAGVRAAIEGARRAAAGAIVSAQG
jgi:hypothetical protein